MTGILFTRTIALLACFLCMCSTAEENAAKLPPPASADSGLMQGFPPPPEKRVSRENFMTPPNNRWAFQHIRELHPTREVYRGAGPASEFKTAAQALGVLSFKVSGEREITVDQWLAESATDSFLVLHQGKIVYERYFNGMAPHTQHQMFSATKSLVGTLVLLWIDRGLIDPALPVSHYIPELKRSAFGDATVQQVLDMTTAIQYNEDYEDPASDIWRYGYVFGVWGKAPDGYKAPTTAYDYLPSLQKKGEHGDAFHYVTPNTDVLSWLISRVSNKRLTEVLEETFWQPMGFQRDGYFWLDGAGTEMAGGGLSITLRDAARFGQMVLQKGMYNGKRIIPTTVAKRILSSGNPKPFNKLYRDPWYENIGYAYHDQWWTFNNSHKAVSALGVHGQAIYIDPVAEMVVVKQSSHPDAEGESNEVDGPMIYHLLAQYLLEGT